MRRLTPTLGLLTLALLGVGLPTATGATGATGPMTGVALHRVVEPPLVEAADATGDVHVNKQAKGLRKSARTSIDITSFTVADAGSKVRFTVRLRDVLTRADGFEFDQIATISMKPADPAATWSAEVAMSAQDPKYGLGYYFADTTDEGGPGDSYCDPVPVKVLDAKDTVRIDIPKRCLPDGPAVLKVKTAITAFKSDALPVFSRDVLKVPGSYDLR